MHVFLLGTLDTKGCEIAFVRDLLHEYGVTTCVVDAGCLGSPAIPADITREQVFAAAGTSLAAVKDRNDRGHAVTAAANGAANLIAAAYARGEVAGVLSMGGSAGTTIGTTAMRSLPLGLPKLMVSTLASGQTRPYVGGKDILMLNAVVDIAGINRISRLVLGEAARAMAGMVTLQSKSPSAQNDKPLIAASMFGVTTPCVEHARKILEAAGYEVLVFHATGNGGEAMEGLIADGLIAGVLDITTTELADELVGGILSAGPTRLTAAGKRGIPQVISVGALDMVNFGPAATVPERFKDRKFYQHNPTVTLMRTTVEENRKLGEEVGCKAAAATGPTCIMVPLKGVSAIDQTGKAFDDPAAREALFEGIRATRGSVELIELDNHINDPSFAEAAARKLLALIATAAVT
ncbi:MAG: Tm-1-like ATP-binding domain-containing protein [Planctomycetota bacterium]